MITDYSKTLAKIRSELRTYITENQIKSLVLGVSGGIDSALVAAIAKPVCDELNTKLIGRSITIESNKPDEIERAKKIGKNFCHDFEEIDLTDKFLNIKNIDEMEGGSYLPSTTENWSENFHKNYKIRMGNIKARLRMIYLYNLASKSSGLVLSTDNYTEYLLGFWTLHGDVGDYSMIQYLWKTEVYELSEYIINSELETKKEKEALQLCIDATATDGLGITNSDLDQILPSWIGSSREGYAEVDRILINMENGIFDENNPVIVRNRRSNFKRNNPTMLTREQIT